MAWPSPSQPPGMSPQEGQIARTGCTDLSPAESGTLRVENKIETRENHRLPTGGWTQETRRKQPGLEAGPASKWALGPRSYTACDS